MTSTPNLELVTSETAMSRWPIGSVGREVVAGARAELVALKACASRSEALERVRTAAANVAAMYQTDPLSTVDGLTDTEFLARINTLRAAIKAACRECDGTGQGEPSWDGEKYNPRDCAKCGGSDAV